jgi:hypothetical protein
MPGYRETENPDQLVQEIYDNEIKLRMPAETYRRNNVSIKLTTKEYNDRLRIQGEILKPRLEQLINAPQYQSLTGGTDGGKAKVMKQMVTTIRSSKELDALWLQENPQVFERWMLEAEQAQQELTGGIQ